MKKYILLYLIFFTFGSKVIFAQEIQNEKLVENSAATQVDNNITQEDGDVVPQNSQDAPKEADTLLNDDYIEKLNSELKDKNSEISKLKRNLAEKQSFINTQKNILEENKRIIDDLKNQIIESDEALITVASNFMYIPYEEFSISDVALEAFNKIHTPELRKEYNNRYIILSNYKEHVKELSEFLEATNKQFAGLALLRPSSDELIKSLDSLKIYQDYTAYDDWENTYLGKFLKKVRNTIVKMQNDSQPDVFKELIDELSSLNIK